jgi:regulator of RNase E activity RraA
VHGAGIPRALMSVGWNEPVSCGGVTVVPGDVILGDENGVVAIPPALVAEVVRVGLEHEAHEEFTKLRLQQGGSLMRYYPMNESALAEYAAWRAEHPIKE